ncbi:MAG: hypothetical protein AAF934_03065 [Bacteroidota bacterium]
MKKLVVLILPIAIGMAAFTAGCTALSVEEDYENEIQIIDKDDVRTPDERGTDDPNF